MGTMQAIDVVLKGWKMLVGVPEGDWKNWDTVHKRENEADAYKLILLFGNWEEAVKAMEYVFHWHIKRGLCVTLKSIVRHSDLFREQMREVE
jgi:hypothetical protein